MVKHNTSNAVMRGIIIPAGSRATSRANGSRQNRISRVWPSSALMPAVRIGKTRCCSL
jgi:hypothetical protein